ncbi:hypothetical protein [Nocardia wallacei]|uniref:hypothetical protein n=1 Tax=Nocardia wallacei TaxID=480035 RepID=UPI002453B831|nr:hypothetical protein [Nocardia wallacei]
MSERPTPAQAKVLKAIQRQLADMQRMVDRAEESRDHTGAWPSAAWSDDLDDRARRHHELARAAAAAGVPQAWIDQVRTRGEYKLPWRVDLHWREPDSPDRATLLDRFHRQVQQVQDMAAVAAAHAERGARAEPGTASLFDRRFRLLAQRLGAMAALLKISSSEAEQLWGEHTFAAAADSVRDATPDQLARRWHDHVRADTAHLALQAHALSDAGISAGLARRPPPTAEDMVHRVHDLLATADLPAPSPGGREIAAAADAVGITADAPDTPTPPTPAPHPEPTTTQTGTPAADLEP